MRGTVRMLAATTTLSGLVAAALLVPVGAAPAAPRTATPAAAAPTAAAAPGRCGGAAADLHRALRPHPVAGGGEGVPVSPAPTLEDAVGYAAFRGLRTVGGVTLSFVRDTARRCTGKQIYPTWADLASLQSRYGFEGCRRAPATTPGTPSPPSRSSPTRAAPRSR